MRRRTGDDRPAANTLSRRHGSSGREAHRGTNAYLSHRKGAEDSGSAARLCGGRAGASARRSSRSASRFAALERHAASQLACAEASRRAAAARRHNRGRHMRAAKRREAALDYDDLILKTRRSALRARAPPPGCCSRSTAASTTSSSTRRRTPTPSNGRSFPALAEEFFAGEGATRQSRARCSPSATRSSRSTASKAPIRSASARSAETSAPRRATRSRIGRTCRSPFPSARRSRARGRRYGLRQSSAADGRAHRSDSAITHQRLPQRRARPGRAVGRGRETKPQPGRLRALERASDDRPRRRVCCASALPRISRLARGGGAAGIEVPSRDARRHSDPGARPRSLHRRR